IYKDDLNDPEQARGTFKEFLKRYPHNRLGADARDAIADLDKAAADEKAADSDNKAAKTAPPAKPVDKDKASKNATTADTSSSSAPARPADKSDKTTDNDGESLPRVTGIRHWSTPDYTRVAIDVEGDVK